MSLRALPAAAVAAAVLAAAPGTAQAGWSGAHDVRGAGAIRSAPALAANQRGDVVLAWIGARHVMVATAHRGGRLGRAHRVPGKLAAVRKPIAIKAAIDETGLATVAWSDCRPIEPGPSPACGGEVRASVRLPGHGFSDARRVGDTEGIAQLGEVDVRSGQAAVTYAQRKRGTRFAAFVAHSAGRAFSRQRIARFARYPGVVRGGDGAERLLYVTDAGVHAVTRAASGSLGRARQVTRARVRNYLSAGGGRGQQALIWKTADTGILREALLLPGRSIAPRTLDRGPGRYGFAIDGGGGGQFVTLFANQSKLEGIRYSRRVPGSRRFAAPRDLPKAGGGRALDVSVRPDGAAAVSWDEPGSVQVRVGILGIDGRMRATRSFAAGRAGGTVDPETSIDRRGRVLLTWQDGDRLRVARYAGG